MGIGRTYQGEQYQHVDRVSGREILQLTNYLGHSYQFYFTHPCWLNGGRSFIFNSERENQSNLFRYDLATGLITQLTDFTTRTGAKGCLSPGTNCLYTWTDSGLQELKLHSLEERLVCDLPRPWVPAGPAATADGRHVCVLLVEGLNGAATPRKPSQDGGSAALFKSHPRTRIVRIDVATGRIDVLHEDRRYIAHVNTSPTQPDLLTFCHEGPWEQVDQRIWGLNLDTGKVWPIRPQNGDFSVVAEHWFADGKRIGFRSHLRGSGDTRFGHIRFDNKDPVEAELSAYSRHFHSLDGSLVVGDGSPVYPLPAIVNRCATWPYILLYPWTDNGYATARILTYHGSTFNVNPAHCHPHITPDGQHVMYTSDTSGYANIYLVEIGDVAGLPELNLEMSPHA